jgi:hypothetical protein
MMPEHLAHSMLVFDEADDETSCRCAITGLTYVNHMQRKKKKVLRLQIYNVWWLLRNALQLVSKG